STPSPAAATPAPAQAKVHHRAAGLLDRADHATVEVKEHGQWVTVTLDRGKISASVANSVTLVEPDGHSVTVALGTSTRYAGVLTSATSLQAGKEVSVTSQAGTALSVSGHTPHG
ncbi:MAG: hypothetical protein M3R71_04425, partial [Actinomycetota bacterium]|nr:hypothetical protein [Actinomycetota bacterium]